MNVCRTVLIVAMKVLMRELPWIYEIKRKGKRVTCVKEITEKTMNRKSLTKYKKMIDETLIDEW
ncbi:hypothetical protein ALC56_01289 [Trachymyrmex septentrionalis]|uniref:Uncharacterized protein n=1 Tax=Trachymyrmex septentrionalis TaxID=34720 RepID=A0A151K0P8_9HYME|nr:hypothetical protein ALC56_01289 [Trachymyrmex septentrionalis]